MLIYIIWSEKEGNKKSKGHVKGIYKTIRKVKMLCDFSESTLDSAIEEYTNRIRDSESYVIKKGINTEDPKEELQLKIMEVDNNCEELYIIKNIEHRKTKANDNKMTLMMGCNQDIALEHIKLCFLLEHNYKCKQCEESRSKFTESPCMTKLKNEILTNSTTTIECAKSESIDVTCWKVKIN